jgi:hypothetical protein
MNKLLTNRCREWAIAGLLITATGCVGSQPQSAMDAMEAGMAFVEGYIEFGGPDARWAGPESIILHVDARDGVDAKLDLTPTIFKRGGKKGGASTARRALASAGNAVAIPSEAVRGMLADLAATLDSPDRAFRGCLSPVRVRLIRSDGAVVERQGCRTQIAWTRTASRIFSDLLSLAVDGRLPPRDSPDPQPSKDPGPPWIQTEKVILDLNATYTARTR